MSVLNLFYIYYFYWFFFNIFFILRTLFWGQRFCFCFSIISRDSLKKSNHLVSLLVHKNEHTYTACVLSIWGQLKNVETSLIFFKRKKKKQLIMLIINKFNKITKIVSYFYSQIYSLIFSFKKLWRLTEFFQTKFP